MNKYYWSGISRDERIQAISEITGIVSRYGAILNFQRFSDISLNLLLELEENRLRDLHLNLNKIISIESPDTSFSDSKTDCHVLLNITFIKGTGDLVIEVPNIPE
jgi:hypothetical protein